MAKKVSKTKPKPTIKKEIPQVVPTALDIKGEILKHVHSKYSTGNPILKNWKIGITNNIKRRKTDMIRGFGTKRLAYLNHWTTTAVEESLHIEKYFCDLGMQRCNSQRFHSPDSITVYTYALPISFRKQVKSQIIKRI